MVQIDDDVFSCILSHVSESGTIHNILAALPKSHRLFSVALARRWQLPVYLDCSDSESSAASHKVINFLVAEGSTTPHRPIAASIRHLVLSVECEDASLAYGHWPATRYILECLHERLSFLFRRLMNLESFDYYSNPGMGMTGEHAGCLQHLERIRAFGVDCTLLRSPEIPVAHPAYRAEIWDMEPFVPALFPKLTSLDLRRVNTDIFTSISHWSKTFATCHALEHLKIDITEGVWDWPGGGSPVLGASPKFVFPFLGFPSVKRFELVVCDHTLSQSQKGPLNLVHCHLLTELSVDVRNSLGYANIETIKLFDALSPSDFPELVRLEIKDNNTSTCRYFFDPEEKDPQYVYRFTEREYLGLIPSFLNGSLPKLDTLWVDEKTLIPWDLSLQDLLFADLDSFNNEVKSCREALRATFGRLKSLRVGFGSITHLDVGPIISLCDLAKLTQFGFEWNWDAYGHDEPISMHLLVHLAQLPSLTDVHILFPRPGTHLHGTPDPVVNERMLHDVESIFACNRRLCRVGIGNSVVWERHPEGGVLLVSDGSVAPNPVVSKFFHAGFMTRYDWNGVDPNPDNATPPRPMRGEEIERLRGFATEDSGGLCIMT
ncbi:hypothetical protein MSAN_01425300 [Mycena sanguinolenta]|uniref:Uncharacterized protein n=1 Tax=Mycena sanguinolenta TaxID=230812 RepID=A0A8H6Y9I1_9AGAR|nr:hypothetical protein MSAN_01425300 [Mycena sanguinolenta]